MQTDVLHNVFLFNSIRTRLEYYRIDLQLASMIHCFDRLILILFIHVDMEHDLVVKDVDKVIEWVRDYVL